MYCKNVREVHLPIFMMVVSEAPFNFSAIAPPALKECTPTRSGVIPDVSILRFDTVLLRCLSISV